MSNSTLNIQEFLNRKQSICVVGLGYVGLPLATILSRKYSVTGFDINSARISELCNGTDSTREVDENTLKTCSVRFSSDPAVISACRVIIVTVPTPVNSIKFLICFRSSQQPDSRKEYVARLGCCL